MGKVSGGQATTRFPHSIGLVLRRQMFWLAALLTLFFIARSTGPNPAALGPAEPGSTAPGPEGPVGPAPLEPDSAQFYYLVRDQVRVLHVDREAHSFHPRASLGKTLHRRIDAHQFPFEI